MAGLWLGQAFGVFLLPGFGVGSSSPQVPRHPTSMCDAGVKPRINQNTTHTHDSDIIILWFINSYSASCPIFTCEHNCGRITKGRHINIS